jgi:hypothetical protein
LIGPLISAIVSLGVAIMTTPVGWFMAAIAAIARSSTRSTSTGTASVEFFKAICGMEMKDIFVARRRVAGEPVPRLHADRPADEALGRA